MGNFLVMQKGPKAEIPLFPKKILLKGHYGQQKQCPYFRNIPISENLIGGTQCNSFLEDKTVAHVLLFME